MALSLILFVSIFTMMLIPSPFENTVLASSQALAPTQPQLDKPITPNIDNSSLSTKSNSSGRGGGTWSYGWGWGGKSGGGGGGGGGGPVGGGGGGGGPGGGVGGGGPGGGGGGPGSGNGGGFEGCGGGFGGGKNNDICWWQCIGRDGASGGGGGGGGGDGGRGGGRMQDGQQWVGRRAGSRHRPSYSSSLYRVGEYAKCTEGAKCGGMRLLCPMHCQGPCFYDCDVNCKAHCRF